MLVADLHHFLDLPPDAPGPARRLGEHLSSIAAAATAGDAHTPWESALPCRRRPANRRCPGRIIVVYAPIQTHRSAGTAAVCGDDGTISNWADISLRSTPPTVDRGRTRSTTSPSTPRPPRHCAPLHSSTAIVTEQYSPFEHTTTVFILALTDTDLDELIGAVAAEANHEPNRRRQQRLDAAFDALNTAAPHHTAGEPDGPA